MCSTKQSRGVFTRLGTKLRNDRTPAAAARSTTACSPSGREASTSDADVMVGEDGLELVEAVAAAPGEDTADLLRVGLEDRGDVEAALLEAPVGEQGPPQVADAEQSHVLDDVGADDLADGAVEIADVVAAGDVAETAEAGQVAAQLRGGHTDQSGQLMGMDELDLLVC